jgi:hypothetical protein
MAGYGRSLVLRLAGALTAAAIFFGMILYGLANMDAGVDLPTALQEGWMFWVAAAVILLLVILGLRRAGPGPGWGHYAIGFFAFPIAFAAGRIFDSGSDAISSLVFWIVLAVLILVPLPRGGAS